MESNVKKIKNESNKPPGGFKDKPDTLKKLSELAKTEVEELEEEGESDYKSDDSGSEIEFEF